MIVVPASVKVHLALGHTDMRKGLDGLATLIQEHLKKECFADKDPVLGWHGAVPVHQAYRPRKFFLASIGGARRLGDAVAAQLAMLLEGIGWRTPERFWRPLVASSNQHVRVESNMQLDLDNLPTDIALLHRLVRDIVGTIEHRETEIASNRSSNSCSARSSVAVPNASIQISWRSGLRISTAISPEKKRSVRGLRTNKPNGLPIATPCPTICHARICGSISTT